MSKKRGGSEVVVQARACKSEQRRTSRPRTAQTRHRTCAATKRHFVCENRIGMLCAEGDDVLGIVGLGGVGDWREG